MGEIRGWDVGSKRSIGEEATENWPTVLVVQATDTDEALYTEMDRCLAFTYIISPDAGKSRENSITAANIRRIVGANAAIIVTIRGATKRERREFLGWLVENDYIPAFPRFVENEGGLPLPRWRLMNELRNDLEALGEWVYACTGWTEHTQDCQALQTMPPSNWELIW